MKVALGTIEVNDYARRAIGAWYGQELASRETCRNAIPDNGLTWLDDAIAVYAQQQDEPSEQ